MTELDTFLDAYNKLSPDQRVTLQQRGCIIPAFGKSFDAPSKYGYRCKHCGEIGFEFVGESFDQGDGTMVSKPPLGMRIENLPWIQPRLRLEQINRSQPRCQACLATLPSNNGYLIERHVVDITLYKSSRDKAYQAVREHRAHGSSNMASHNADGSPISVSSERPISMQDLAEAKARVEAEAPGITRAAEQLAAKFEGDLPGFLAKGSTPAGRGRK